jgi:hypothetical protein
MNPASEARRLLTQVRKQDWPHTLRQTFAELNRRMAQDEFAPLFADLVAAWVYDGGSRIIPPDEFMRLATEKPWMAEVEAEEAAKRAVEEEAKVAAIDARRAIQEATKGPLADPSLAHIQAQLDWILLVLKERLGVELNSPAEQVNIASGDEFTEDSEK